MESPPANKNCVTHDDTSVQLDKTMQANNSDNDYDHQQASFLMLRAEVISSKKGTETMQTKLVRIFSVLHEADDSIAFTPFKSDIDKTTAGLVTSSHSTTITSPDTLPHSITSLGK